jgi:D-beta-D-heptose 7-phosphate kinase/D-beta-D-heptose 1-phosphate adenosyltransferase
MKIDWKKSVIILSGGFDPIHKGHMRMFREASNLGHQVIVGLNSDEWLTRKKGKPFMEFYERKEILEGIKYISNVVNTPEMDTCRKLDVTMLWGIGGGKIQSSSWLINGGKK